MYLCMDGLSLDRHRSLQKRLASLPLSFADAFEQSLRFQKALSRIIEIPGPLHVAFHMCQCIFTIYSPLLYVLKSILQWKKLRFKKVNESFRLCKALLMIGLEEAERLMWDMFLNDRQTLISKAASDFKDSEERFSVHLAQQYQEYMSQAMTSSTDERRKYLLSFIQTTKKFLMFWKAVRSGDKIYQEYVMMKFLGIYMLLKKNQYVEITLNTIEREYNDISFKELNQLRVNSYVQYKSDDPSDDFKYDCVALDEMQENVNKWTKELCLDGNHDTWVKHSPNVMVGRRCIAFTDGEYRRQLLYYDDQMMGKDNTTRRSYATHGVSPKLERERSAVYEFIVKFFGTEVSSRKFSVSEAWTISKGLTTVVKLSAKEKIVDVVDDDLNVVTNIITVNMENQIERDDSNIMDINLTNSRGEIPSVEEEDDISNVENESSTLLVGVHKLALCDLFVAGDELVEKGNFPTVRRNMHRRNLRNQIFQRKVYEEAVKKTMSLALSLNNDGETPFLPLPRFSRGNSIMSNLELNKIIIDNMQKIWSKEPRTFQCSTIKRILGMSMDGTQTTSTLLVRGTGGGKSAVMQTLATIKCGVTIVIENTLSLSADQIMKIRSASQSYGIVQGVHLDSIKRDDQREQLKMYIKNMSESTSIILFTSPEAIVNDKSTELFDMMIQQNIIRLICIDEVHQFVSFGLSFRYDFSKLRNKLFSKIIQTDKSSDKSQELKVPVLFMTATFNSDMLNFLKKLTGLSIYNPTHAWSPIGDFKK